MDLSLQKRKPSVLASTNQSLTSFNDTSALKAAELNKKLCRSHGNDETYSKKTEQTFLCHVLGLSTTGHAITESKVQTDHLSNAQIEEFEQLTIKRLCHFDCVK